jgi:hypothetical protein
MARGRLTRAGGNLTRVRSVRHHMITILKRIVRLVLSWILGKI